MNCKECQERILEALAAGASQLSREASEHQRNCPVCREFGDAQVSLFRSMDAGLHAMVNQSVPPSLLAGLRARLDRPPVTRLGWIPQWSYALLAVVAILIMSIGYVSRRPGDRPNLLGSTPAVSRNASNPVLEVQPARKSPTTSLRPTHKRADREVPSLASSESEPEVIVLAEEREAFAKFVAELPLEREVALALTRPAAVSEDVPVEIAMLQIETLELKPLEGTPRE